MRSEEEIRRMLEVELRLEKEFHEEKHLKLPDSTKGWIDALKWVLEEE